MKSLLFVLAAALATGAAHAETTAFAGGVLSKKQISTSQTQYQLNLKSGLQLKLTDTKKDLTKLNSTKSAGEGGWQPELNDTGIDSSLVLEAIRMLAAQNCSAASISQGMAEILPQELAGSNVNISNLSDSVKSCLSK